MAKKTKFPKTKPETKSDISMTNRSCRHLRKTVADSFKFPESNPRQEKSTIECQTLDLETPERDGDTKDVETLLIVLCLTHRSAHRRLTKRTWARITAEGTPRLGCLLVIQSGDSNLMVGPSSSSPRCQTLGSRFSSSKGYLIPRFTSLP